MSSEDNLSLAGNWIRALRPENSSAKRARNYPPSIGVKSPNLIYNCLKLTSQRQRKTRIDSYSKEIGANKGNKLNKSSNVSNIKICHAKIDSLNCSTAMKEVTTLAIPKKSTKSKPKSNKSTSFWSSELSCWIFRLTPAATDLNGPHKLPSFTYSLSLSSFSRRSSTKICWEPKKTQDIQNPLPKQNQSNVVPEEQNPPIPSPIDKAENDNPNSFLIGLNRLRKNPNMKLYRKSGHGSSFITVCKSGNKLEVKASQHRGKDFRSLFKLDSRSIEVLRHISSQAFQDTDKPLSPSIYRYLLHFYQTRALEDDSVFIWYVFEGFYPLEMLLKQPELQSRSFQELDDFAATYIKIRNEDFNPWARIKLSKSVAYYMLSSYCRMLYEYSSQQTTAKGTNFVLRARFAVFNLEQYAASHKLNLLKDNLNYMKIIYWLFYHENHVLSQYNECIILARKRAEIAARGETAIYISNQEQIDEFYQNRRIVDPDYLSLLTENKDGERFDSAEPKPLRTFCCPLTSCKSSIWDSNFMAHFLHHHCRRMQELWLLDRVIVVIAPVHYTPNQDYCLNMLALHRRPNHTRYTPSRQLNFNLPAKQLYFAEHLPCALMLSVVSRDTLLESSKNPDHWIYIFWIACIDDYPDNLSCRVFIYSKTHSSFTCGVRVLDFIKLSEFQGIAELLKLFEGKYIALDYDTMRTLTSDFTEIIYIDVRYIDKNNDPIDELGEESQWDY